MMSKNWLKQHRHDSYYRRAKEVGYRSRASFKLLHIQERYGIFDEGDIVLDLGAAPGGWSQVASETVGTHGLVVGVDLQCILNIPGIKFIEGDVNDPRTLEKLREALHGRKANVIISDMAPNISGNYSMDHARSVALCERAMELATLFLKRGGNIVMKIFQGDMYEEFLASVRSRFSLCRGFKSKASRAESSEVYIVGKGFIC